VWKNEAHAMRHDPIFYHVLRLDPVCQLGRMVLGLPRQMTIKSVTPEQAQELLQAGAVYVDVRSEPEFEQGHPPGAVNVPIAHLGPGGMTPNPEFLSVMSASFGKNEKLVIGCKAGGRSRRAAEMLEQAGYGDLSDMAAGWDGSRDAFGRPLAGWSRRALPVETGFPEGQRYEDVKRREPRQG
jgi:rhodanese-related sulfurtransferase